MSCAVANATETCTLHLPCNSGIQDPAAPNGPCHCCDLALDEVAVDANPQVSAGQLWTFLIGQVAFLCWLLFLARLQASQLLL